MNMMDGPKFRRKHSSATRQRGRSTEPPAPVPPIHAAAEKSRQETEARHRAETAARQKAEAEEQARQAAEAEQRAKAEAKARRKAEFEEKAQAEALRRVLAARERRQTEAREAAERAERDAKERADREKAAEEARLAEERQRAEAAAAEEARRAEEKAREAAAAEEARLVAEQAAEEQRLREAERAAEQARLIEARKRAEDEANAAEHRAEDARRAEAKAAPLPLTEMLPVTKPASAPADAAPADLGKIDVDGAWNSLADLTVNTAHLDRNRIISASREDPAHAAFDVLRTRLLQTLKENGWRRVAITSPGQGCGKTFTVANLAITLSRQENCRTLVMDLDMRRPSLHTVLGLQKPGSLGDVLRGLVPPEEHLRRMGANPVHAGRNIAFGLNDRVEEYPSELLQDPRTTATLEAIEARFAPDVMLFDLPPALFCDDVIAFRPQFDGVLLVLGGGMTTEREVKEVERRLGDSTPLLGMILNKAEGSELRRYGY
ncbi:nucleotide-binding protein [Antarctobacter jejuensis]|uniref:nucleotide-binding protein n=1 Tax=Antarctobacter jejuensis TaxID=1439938 RepID=UPI003FD0E444